MAPQRRVVLRTAHAAGLLRGRLKNRQAHFLTDRVVAPHQFLDLFLCHVQLFLSLEIDGVDDAVGVDVLPVYMGADQHLTALEVFRQSPRGFVGLPGIGRRALWETLHHVIEHHAAVLVVQQLCAQEFVERRFRLAANAADEPLTIPKCFTHLRHISRHAFHASTRLRAFFVVYEMDDCDFATPPSCNSRRAVLILANSCTAESRLANCTLPIFASTVS